MNMYYTYVLTGEPGKTYHMSNINIASGTDLFELHTFKQSWFHWLRHLTRLPHFSHATLKSKDPGYEATFCAHVANRI